MADQYVEPVATATTVVTLSKIGTIGSAVAAGSAGYLGEHFFAWAGLCATIFFGALGTALSFYFKWKADKREAQSHQMMVLEHNATMARLTGGAGG